MALTPWSFSLYHFSFLTEKSHKSIQSCPPSLLLQPPRLSAFACSILPSFCNARRLVALCVKEEQTQSPVLDSDASPPSSKTVLVVGGSGGVGMCSHFLPFFLSSSNCPAFSLCFCILFCSCCICAHQFWGRKILMIMWCAEIDEDRLVYNSIFNICLCWLMRVSLGFWKV